MTKGKIVRIVLIAISVLWVIGLVGVLISESNTKPGQGVGLLLFLYAGFSVIIVLPLVLILRAIARQMTTPDGMSTQSSSWQKILLKILYVGLGLFALWFVGGTILNMVFSEAM